MNNQIQDTIFIAHRGESCDAPENTLAAINLAWERNTDAVEIDVQMSKDDQIVVIHDDNTLRTGGKDKDVRDQTLEELKRLDVGSYKDEQWANQRIPSLNEALDTIPDGKRLFVEIKYDTAILSPLKVSLDKRPHSSEQVVLIGLEFDVMQAVKKAFPKYETCWVCELEKDDEGDVWNPDVDELISKACNAGLDGLDVLACDGVDENFVQHVRSAGLKLYVWTVNDVETASRLRDLGVDGITTDRPMWLKKNLRKLSV